MSASTQTVVALGLVTLAAAALIRIFVQRRKQPGCGADCGAVSPEIKKLQAKLRR